MVQVYAWLGQHCWPWRRWFWVLAATGAVLFGAVVVVGEGRESELWMLLAIALMLWALWLVTLSHLFARPLTVSVPETGWRARWRARWQRLGQKLKALFLSAYLLAVLFVSFRALMLLLGAD